MSFDGIAPFYRALESIVFGNALQRARIAFISELGDCRHALLVGEGNGRFLSELVATNREIRVTCVEQSATMIQLARERICDPQQNARVDFVEADIHDLEVPPAFDLIVTNFFLDCFDETELPGVVETLAKCAAPDAKWLVTEFAIPDRGTARVVGRVLVAAMYAFFRATTHISVSHLVGYAPLLEACGFNRNTRRGFVGRVVVAEMWVGAIDPITRERCAPRPPRSESNLRSVR